jgi:hypothetical protein
MPKTCLCMTELWNGVTTGADKRGKIYGIGGDYWQSDGAAPRSGLTVEGIHPPKCLRWLANPLCLMFREATLSPVMCNRI